MTSTALASRPWRNNNPGDLRTLPAGERWAGQSGVDASPGGPFARFATRTDGWHALAQNLLAYQDVHQLHTVRGIIGRFAPALENDTGGYITQVCMQINRGADQAINVHDEATMLALCGAIARAEGGPRLAWPKAEMLDGVHAAGVVGAHPLPAAPASVPVGRMTPAPARAAPARAAPAAAAAPIDQADALDIQYNKGA